MTARTVLITGHKGFLGGRMSAFLLRKPGLRVAGADLTGGGAPGMLARRCDLRDPPAVRRLMSEVRPALVFHLAGPPSVGGFGALVESHVVPAANLLDAAVRLPQPWPRIVLAGSAGEYGLARRNPVRESDPAEPVTPYGAVKLCVTAMGRALARAGLPVVAARIFNVLGPGLHPRLSAASFARQVARIEAGLAPPVLEAGNLSPRRDFVDVSDVCRALWLLALRGEPGEVYNVCSGRSVPIRRVVDALISLSSAAGRIEVRVRPDLLRKADVPDIRGSLRKTSARLGWRPSVPLERSLAAMLAHERGLAARQN